MFFKGFTFTALIIGAFGLGQKYSFSLDRDFTVHWADEYVPRNEYSTDTMPRDFERIRAESNQFPDGAERFAMTVAESPEAICNHQGEVNKEDCSDNSQLFIGKLTQKNHYICWDETDFPRAGWPNSRCIDLYEITER